jgi:hypothetical protein
MVKKRKIKDITSLMFRDWKNLLLIIIFDVLFMLVLSSLRFVQISLDNMLFSLLANIGKTSLVYSIFYVVLELFLVILVYSFFKYFIVKFIFENFKKAEFKLKELLAFLRLNLIIFIPLIVMFAIVLDLILLFFNKWLSIGGIDPFKFVFVILAIGILSLILFILIYTFINILHFSFLKEPKLGKLLKKGVIDSFRVESYKMYWNNLKIVFTAIAFLLIAHFLVKSFIFNDFSSYVRNLGNYKIFIYSIITLVIYFLLLFNRFNFYISASDIHKKRLKEGL